MVSIQEQAWRFVITLFYILGGGLWINMAIDYYKQQKYRRFGWCIMCIIVVILGLINILLCYD